jgi:hypothetical protein
MIILLLQFTIVFNNKLSLTVFISKKAIRSAISATMFFDPKQNNGFIIGISSIFDPSPMSNKKK